MISSLYPHSSPILPLCDSWHHGLHGDVGRDTINYLCDAENWHYSLFTRHSSLLQENSRWAVLCLLARLRQQHHCDLPIPQTGGQQWQKCYVLFLRWEELRCLFDVLREQHRTKWKGQKIAGGHFGRRIWLQSLSLWSWCPTRGRCVMYSINDHVNKHAVHDKHIPEKIGLARQWHYRKGH